MDISIQEQLKPLVAEMRAKGMSAQTVPIEEPGTGRIMYAHVELKRAGDPRQPRDRRTAPPRTASPDMPPSLQASKTQRNAYLERTKEQRDLAVYRHQKKKACCSTCDHLVDCRSHLSEVTTDIYDWTRSDYNATIEECKECGSDFSEVMLRNSANKFREFFEMEY